jgi:transcriptional regulator with XRE-family HTH domain
MSAVTAAIIGANIRAARRAAGLTQAELGLRAGVSRVQIVRFEAGSSAPGLDEGVRIAAALKCPLDRLIRATAPASALQEIAIQLYHLGARDLVVADPQVPGSFRHPEEVLVLALSGDRPEPRVVEAMPFVLANGLFRASLVAAFSLLHDRRARTRVAWLADVALALGRLSTAPLTVLSELLLRSLARRAAQETAPDSLGHPAAGTVPPIWRRWNITYAGTMDDFARRTGELRAALGAAPDAGGAS